MWVVRWATPVAMQRHRLVHEIYECQKLISLYRAACSPSRHVEDLEILSGVLQGELKRRDVVG